MGGVSLDPIRVGMAEMHIGASPEKMITTVGSCIALCLYDRDIKIGGMAHIVLPVSRRFNQNSQFKFADTAVPALFSALESKGASRVSIAAKIAGGANMFPLVNKSILNIGEENVITTKKSLNQIGLKLAGEDVRGTKGRKIEFHLSTGDVLVQKLSGEVTVL